MDEQQAILRLKQGDIGGLELLVNRYQSLAGLARLRVLQEQRGRFGV